MMKHSPTFEVPSHALRRCILAVPMSLAANQALQPTRMLVTFCAYAQPAPSTRVADL